MNLCIRNFVSYLTQGFAWLALLLNLGVVTQASADTSVRFNSAIALYPHASLEYQKFNSGEEHRFLLSTPKRISNTLNIEKEVLLSGKRNNLLLKVKAAGTSKDAFLYYQKLLLEQGEVSYSCEERACGSSNYWANSIFNESKLYGRDSEQYYLAGRLSVNQQNYFVSVYIVKNGRKQQFIYLSYILDITPVSDIENDKQADQLRKWQKGVPFERPYLDDEQLAFLSQALDSNKSLSLWVVGFADISEGQKVTDAITVSEKALNTFSVEINRQLNLDAGRVMVKNIGPFDLKPENYAATTWFRLYLLQ